MKIHDYAEAGDIIGVKQELDRGIDIDIAKDWDTQTPLMRTAFSSEVSVEMIEFLIEKGADINAVSKDKERETILALAVQLGKLDLIKLLIDKGADINYRRKYNYDVLLDAFYSDIKENRTAIIKLLVEKGAKLTNIETKHRDSALRKASEERLFDLVKVFLDRGAKLNHLKWTKLMYAVVYGSLDDVKVALKKDKDSTKKDFLDRNAWLLSLEVGDLEKAKLLFSLAKQNNIEYIEEPLLHAACSKNPEVIEWLLEKGFNPNVANKDGITPLMQATYFGNSKGIKLLLKAGTPIDTADKNGETALMKAAKRGETACAKLLIEAGANVNLVNGDKDTVLMIAVENRNLDIVKLLLEAGADVNKGDEDSSPLRLVAMFGYADYIKLLTEAGAEVDPKDNSEYASFLMRAAESGSLESVKLLVKAGANIDYKNEYGGTALSEARSLEIARFLLKEGEDINDFNEKVRQELRRFYISDKLCVSKEDYLANRTRRYGTSNPELMDIEFWKDMVKVAGDGYTARNYFNDQDYSLPVWAFRRFGRSITELPDGRVIEIAGEHEDYYDVDFCIYNDVFVYYGDGRFEIYGYPEEVFPPTDFHTATLYGDYIYIVGSLSYIDYRETNVYNQTQVYRLHINTLQIEEVKTTGKNPGWISRHKAYLRKPATIYITGGKVWSRPNEYLDNHQNYTLNLETMVWEQV